MPDSAAPTGHGGPAALDSAVLRITDQRGNPWGVGFLVSEDTALTCAHVVSSALGTAEGRRPPASARVYVDLPLLRGPSAGRAPVPARIVHFAAGSDDGDGSNGDSGHGDSDGSDVAVLRLEAAIPEGRPVSLVDAPDVWGHSARAFGFPEGRPAGVWHAGVLRSRQASGWIQADLASDGYRVSGGFSGSPVWDEELAAVVGMVAVAESGEPAASYLIPADSLFRGWKPLRELALPRSPFRGLAAFREADAASFHGREEESEELTAEVAAQRWVCLVGPSGSGKSSLALAGVVPRLRRQDFRVAVLRPASGGRPLSALAAALLPLLDPDLPEVERLARVPGLADVLRRHGVADTVARILEKREAHGLLVVVDQFEELLASPSPLVDELAAALYAEPPVPSLHVLTTLRADFLEEALCHPQVGAALRNRIYALGSLGPEQLRQMVTAPVAAVPGVDYEPGLVERLLSDTGQAPGALPLLGFTLDRLWRKQSGGLLTHRDYDAVGGVTGALGHHAERLWSARVPQTAVPAARRLFTALVRIPLGSGAATRRTALRTELDADSWDIAQVLADARLLVTGRGPEGTETVEVAHEALISGWPRLAEWTARDRAFLVWRETLRHDRERWEHGGRTNGLLPTRPVLEAAAPWLRDRGPSLTEDERDYLRLGREHQRVRTRRRRVLTTALASLTALALILGSLFTYYRHVSRERTEESASRALAQSSADLGTSDPVLSVMTALAAYRTSPTEQARDALLRAQLAHRTDRRVLSGSDGSVDGAVTSADGNVLLTHSNDGKSTLYVHAMTGTVRKQRLDLPYQAALDFVSRDGRRAGFFTEDRSLVWFDVRRDGRAGDLVGAAHRLPAQLNSQAHAAISGDGRYVAQSGAEAEHLAWWDLETGGTGKVPLPGIAKPSTFDGVRFGGDNHTLLANIYDKKSKKSALLSINRTTRHAESIVPPVPEFRLSGEGNWVAGCENTGKNGKSLVVRRTDSTSVAHRYTGEGLGTNDPYCDLKAVDDSGRWALTQGRDPETLDERIYLLDLAHNRIASTEPMLPGEEAVESVTLVHGTPTALTKTENTMAYVPLPVGRKIEKPLEHPSLSPGGKAIVGFAEGGGKIERRTPDGGAILAAERHTESDLATGEAVVGFSDDGELLADRIGKNLVQIRLASTLRPLRKITTADPPRYDPVSEYRGFDLFFRGDTLVTRSGPVIQEWETSTGRRTAQVDLRNTIPSASRTSDVGFSRHPDPHHIAVIVRGDPKVHLVDVTTGRQVKEIDTGSDTASVTFDRTGKYFSLLRQEKNLELWQSDPPEKKIGPLFTGNEDAQNFVARFNGDGQFLLASLTAAHFYDVQEGRKKETYNFGAGGGVDRTGYSFLDSSRDGNVLLFNDFTGDTEYRTIRLDTDQWQRELCRMIGYREFTDDERANLGAPVPEKSLCREG